MKKKLLLGLLIISLVINLILLGNWLLFTPTEEEEIALSEMVQKTVESPDYEMIASNEKVIAINGFVEKLKGGAFPYYFSVNVYTDKQTHLFTCADAVCSTMESTGTMYSIYQDEGQRLPFDK
ncbi:MULTISPECIES: hypothetical protein [unclassified Planococcus (in: firmicutes)]|uniref:hypothetical protein n=1 Tax=unclassified Planococcus (in: firmicutes) TaxID=2662419 RepID=UPI000C3412B4|nr:MULTISPECIES: hypothetical protein [unclassified Planococcus (in: firmicutes)]AUD12488.1 hypothetical protein CW734_01060 [Planococcus sp. MB-3u-03]PKG48703.1 hypothetical protein CXF66_00230 [Planococcus sp. Urea-trap-24]PKG90847.1 hypothetical protein CXF91_03505 [Planococcus sp. Urea-3u-39]PKH38133.1 hypothetical protein CXF77_12670 [Planococcus sp. MB-3u-09]